MTFASYLRIIPVARRLFLDEIWDYKHHCNYHWFVAIVRKSECLPPEKILATPLASGWVHLRIPLPLWLCVVALRMSGKYLSHTTCTLWTFLKWLSTYDRITYRHYSSNVLDAPGFSMFTMVAPSIVEYPQLAFPLALDWIWLEIGFGTRSTFSILGQQWRKTLILMTEEAF